MDIPAHAEIAHSGLPQKKRLEADLYWVVPHVPWRHKVKGLNWTELPEAPMKELQGCVVWVPSATEITAHKERLLEKPIVCRQFWPPTWSVQALALTTTRLCFAESNNLPVEDLPCWGLDPSSEDWFPKIIHRPKGYGTGLASLCLGHVSMSLKAPRPMLEPWYARRRVMRCSLHAGVRDILERSTGSSFERLSLTRLHLRQTRSPRSQ